jgi:4-diphosphocytidyl-2-C-methyl-D-erythritol kinase
MIFFSPAKINIGLQIFEKRPDGFHNIQSVIFPTGLCDILEINILQSKNQEIRFSQSGLRFSSDLKDNLCLKAVELFAGEAYLPPLEMHLHKQIPVGAGLGGGSSNASTTLLGLNSLIDNPLSKKRLAELAEMLGSDCPFFLHREAKLMEGRGEILTPVQLKLKSFYLVLLFPDIHVSTAIAYQGVQPSYPDQFLKEIIQKPVRDWKNEIINDFELTVFAKFPRLKELKHRLYANGAIYASMSGSGSSLYGIYDKHPSLPADLKKLLIWEGPI